MNNNTRGGKARSHGASRGFDLCWGFFLFFRLLLPLSPFSQVRIGRMGTQGLGSYVPKDAWFVVCYNPPSALKAVAALRLIDKRG